MSHKDDIRLSIDGPIATVTLRRTAKRNALDSDFSHTIAGALHEAEDRGARILVLRSAIPVFSSGVDLSEPIRLDSDSPELVIADTLLRTELFVVSVFEGPALAGALMFAALSPLAVAGEQATFWLPERRLGLYPGRVLAYLEETVPPRQAHWLALTEERVTAQQALQLGLISTVLAPGGFEHDLDSLLRDLAAADPAFLSAARRTWLMRFRSEQFLRRTAEYDAVLTDNLRGTRESR
ncbi:enoyl-CoA hydratase/isomerase family protein [Leucobacter sp. CSA1]|uniref:Enoyl-CoA hydratase/isomerase family protein n=1 Tax=Leucobacter chromiisoli TaxID=2796471 RepID=A0A934Q7K1_9MICO|nr:enoyl-CoA hydratase/isomerase family protein [Leucobacter chromiisoli]MBK0418810.1 enoyl-CoA hydratase/isomerase family protein [Leucobacter chromiisoli]